MGIRVNSASSEWFHDDLLLALEPGVAGLIIPKAESVPGELQRLLDRGLKWIPLIETATGIAKSQSIAAEQGVVRLAFGSIDFQVDMGIEGDEDALQYFRSRLVLASRLAGCASPVDGVTTTIENQEQVREESRRTRRFGMGAKLCIHPAQIAAVHEAFEPSSEERGWAHRVVSAANASSGAAVTVDGKMVDLPVLLRAQRIAAAPAAGSRLRGLKQKKTTAAQSYARAARRPPSTGNTAPFTKPALSPSKKRIALATSTGSAIRPSGELPYGW